MINISDNDKETLLKNIDFLKKFLQENDYILSKEQDDSELVDLIKREYRVSSSELDAILKILESRKKKTGISERGRKKIIADLDSYCHIVGIKKPVIDEDGKVDVEALKKKISTKRHQLKKAPPNP